MIDYDIDAVRAHWIGRTVESSSGRYPVEHDPIRRHCHMVGDTNPLFLDAEFARDFGPYGAVIVPPSMLPHYFASDGPWPRPPRETESGTQRRQPRFTYGVPTPGNRGINVDTTWEFHAPIRVGDVLSVVTVVEDVFIKPIRLDPLAVWIVTLSTITNQHAVDVANWRNTMLVHRSPRQIEADDAGQPE